MLEVNQVFHLDALELLRQLDDASVDLIITDPPYGCGKVSAWQSTDRRFDEVVGNDEVNSDWLPNAYRVLQRFGAMYVFAKWQNANDWKVEITKAGFHLRNQIVWDKMQTGAGDPDTCYAPEYELILFAVKGRHLLRGNRPSDIIHYPKVPPLSLVHPYEKPIGLLERMILTSSDDGDLVIDPFAGSGTTGVAAIKHGRRFIGGDISPEYVAVANKRRAQPFTPRLFD